MAEHFTLVVFIEGWIIGYGLTGMVVRMVSICPLYEVRQEGYCQAVFGNTPLHPPPYRLHPGQRKQICHEGSSTFLCL